MVIRREKSGWGLEECDRKRGIPLLKENVGDGLDRTQRPHMKKNNQDLNVGSGKGILQPWEVCLSQKPAHTLCVRSFPTPALADEPAKPLGRFEHPCGMSSSKKYCKDVFVCFANSAAVVQCVYPTTANNQEGWNMSLQRFAKVVVCPGSLGFFIFLVLFCSPHFRCNFLV